MITSSTKKRSQILGTDTDHLAQLFLTKLPGINFKMIATLLIGGAFLFVLLLSENLLLKELSKAVLIITLLNAFRFIQPNSSNLK